MELAIVGAKLVTLCKLFLYFVSNLLQGSRRHSRRERDSRREEAFKKGRGIQGGKRHSWMESTLGGKLNKCTHKDKILPLT